MFYLTFFIRYFYLIFLFIKPGDGVLGRRGRAPGQRPAPAGEHHVKDCLSFVVPAMLYALRESLIKLKQEKKRKSHHTWTRGLGG